MTEDNIYVGKFIKGKEIVSTSSDGKIVNFFFQDGTYECAPIVEGKLIIDFDEVTVSHETGYTDMDGEVVYTPVELKFYKMLEAVPITDEDGNETRKTEIGSIQEVPNDLGDYWVEREWAEEIEAPKESVMDKVSNVISGILGNK